jgi:hypothetical protein
MGKKLKKPTNALDAAVIAAKEEGLTYAQYQIRETTQILKKWQKEGNKRGRC